jgi:hypothetical protein
MADTSKCSVCGAQDSWRHSLLDCNMSRCVWALVDEEVTQHMSVCAEPSAKQWLFTMMETLKHDEFIQVVVTLWALWYARRRLIHEGEQQSPLSTFLFARRFIEDLALAPKQTAVKPVARQAAQNRWIPPDDDQAKINVDTALARSGMGGALAAVCRNADGMFMGASALTVVGGLSPTTLEAMSCREGLSLAQDLGLPRICIASD